MATGPRRLLRKNAIVLLPAFVAASSASRPGSRGGPAAPAACRVGGGGAYGLSIGTGLLPSLCRRSGRFLQGRELTGVEALALDLDVLAAGVVVRALRVLVEVDDAGVLGPAVAALGEPAERVPGRAAAARTQSRSRLLHPSRREERAGVLHQAGQQVEVAPEDVGRRRLHR